MSDHHVVWTFSYENVSGRMVCSAPPEAKCRWETTGCDCESLYGMDVDSGGPFHLAYNDMDGTDTKHQMKYGGPCQVCLFSNEEDASMSAQRDVQFEVARTPVTPEWQGDYFTWKPDLGPITVAELRQKIGPS